MDVLPSCVPLYDYDGSASPKSAFLGSSRQKHSGKVARDVKKILLQIQVLCFQFYLGKVTEVSLKMYLNLHKIIYLASWGQRKQN